MARRQEPRQQRQLDEPPTASLFHHHPSPPRTQFLRCSHQIPYQSKRPITDEEFRGVVGERGGVGVGPTERVCPGG
ncbi:hypothetical protein D187_000522 [Cystobacter fuscus DSM 2262]|uniref:Uncharacterized protein n=1 Tax=Cystobacter fuscus (strain ATCC 25194 / DSM 2262 / NBRC 100088 / M29) TaxID=1242864 RepID=S9PRG4_CYSF2|nr:hypothetical protein D187_000522 [Cystobacter fuscus DSM 2262]